MLNSVAQSILLTALAGTPDVLEALCGRLSPEDPRWDFRPDPARFTVREIIAHLAELEPSRRERAILTRDQEQPHFAPHSVNADCSHQDPFVLLTQFRANRRAYLEVLYGLAEADWARIAHSARLGSVTLEMQVAMSVAHDGYHTGQIAQWLAKAVAVGITSSF